MSNVPAVAPFPCEGAGCADRRVNSVLRMIDERHAHVSLTLKTFAAEFGISREHLGRLFVRCTGVRFGAYTHGIRMHWGARFLTDGGGVAAAANQLGYSSASNFIGEFKRFFRMTPKRYATRSSRRQPATHRALAASA